MATNVGADTSGNRGDHMELEQGSQPTPAPQRVLGARALFQRKNPGAPGKLGKSSTKAESLAKLRGKGALA